MKSTYGQYCPLALASEVLGERWTILIVFALCDSSSRFNSLQRALPRISASTLSQRLRSLEESGVISKQKSADGSNIEYQLTDAGAIWTNRNGSKNATGNKRMRKSGRNFDLDSVDTFSPYDIYNLMHVSVFD